MRRGVYDGDAWRLIKIVFWGILLLLGIRLALALMPMIQIPLDSNCQIRDCLTIPRAAISSRWAAIPLRTKRLTCFRPRGSGVLRPTDRQMR
jgi:hypothetical protein